MSQANAIDGSQGSNRKQVIGYWVVTVLFCLPMGAGGVFDFLQTADVLESFAHLGYPAYFAVMLGIAKVLGVAALLAPGLGRVKEWAYAGFGIDLIAAAVSHLAVGDPPVNIVLPVVLFGMMVASYMLRPASRRLDS